MRTAHALALGTIAALCLLGLPLRAEEEQPAGRAEAKAAKPAPPATRAEAEASRPARRGIHAYRERINLVSRKPLRKEIPAGARTPDERQWSGIRDARPLVARKRTHPPRVYVKQFEHVKTVARGPIPFPAKRED